MSDKPVTVPASIIESRIFLIRKQKVMIDSDLATLYEVLTKNLNLAVRRNRQRFQKTLCSSSRLKKANL